MLHQDLDAAEVEAVWDSNYRKLFFHCLAWVKRHVFRTFDWAEEEYKLQPVNLCPWHEDDEAMCANKQQELVDYSIFRKVLDNFSADSWAQLKRYFGAGLEWQPQFAKEEKEAEPPSLRVSVDVFQQQLQNESRRKRDRKSLDEEIDQWNFHLDLAEAARDIPPSPPSPPSPSRPTPKKLFEAMPMHKKARVLESLCLLKRQVSGAVWLWRSRGSTWCLPLLRTWETCRCGVGHSIHWSPRRSRFLTRCPRWWRSC